MTTQSNSPTINRTITRTYVSASRNVSVVNNTGVYQGQTTTTLVYFDQNTGFMVEMYTYQPDSRNPGACIETSLKATETNMWSPDLLGLLSNNLVYIMAGIAVVIVVIAAAIVLRRKKPPPRQPPEATQTSTADTKPG